MPRAQILSGLLAFGIPALFAQSSTPTIRTSVRLVTVPTLVFSKEGRLIPGLEANDFRVFDKTRQVRIALDTFPPQSPLSSLFRPIKTSANISPSL
jgi:hypothetical protein